MAAAGLLAVRESRALLPDFTWTGQVEGLGLWVRAFISAESFAEGEREVASLWPVSTDECWSGRTALVVYGLCGYFIRGDRPALARNYEFVCLRFERGAINTSQMCVEPIAAAAAAAAGRWEECLRWSAVALARWNGTPYVLRQAQTCEMVGWALMQHPTVDEQARGRDLLVRARADYAGIGATSRVNHCDAWLAGADRAGP